MVQTLVSKLVQSSLKWNKTPFWLYCLSFKSVWKWKSHFEEWSWILDWESEYKIMGRFCKVNKWKKKSKVSEKECLYLNLLPQFIGLASPKLKIISGIKKAFPRELDLQELVWQLFCLVCTHFWSRHYLFWFNWCHKEFIWKHEYWGNHLAFRELFWDTKLRYLMRF